MPALANKTYFNYGGQGPLPDPSLKAITDAWKTIQELGPFSSAVWPYVNRSVSGLRQLLAAWFGVGEHRVAFTENVTTGCLLPLWGLPWNRGDEILLGDGEHPGVVAACRELALRHGLHLETLPVAGHCGTVDQARDGVLEALDQCLGPRTSLVVLSHVLWNTGQVMPIAAVASRLANHPNHPWLLVDAAQSLGAIPVAAAADAADIYACTGHKWCCGPEGLGAVALSERLLEASRPTLIGWRSLSNESSSSSSFHADARRFEVATSCTPLFSGLQTSLRLLEDEGSSQQRLAAIRERAAQLWYGLQRIDDVKTLLEVPPSTGLVSFTMTPGGEAAAGDIKPSALVERLGGQAIWLRSLPNPSCLRACTHITTTAEEVETLLAALDEMAGHT